MGLACRGDQVWATTSSDWKVIFRFDGDEWTAVYHSYYDSGLLDKIQFKGVWLAEDGSAWVSGGERKGGALSDYHPQVWRIAGEQLTPVLEGASDKGLLSAVAFDALGTAWAVGENGLVLEFSPDEADQ